MLFYLNYFIGAIISSPIARAQRKMRSYTRGELLGEGTFGKVYCAFERGGGRAVAIKRLHNAISSKEGAELPMLREIMLLHELKHENVVELLDVYCQDGSIHLVFEFCVTDIEAIIRDLAGQELNAACIKGYMLGTLQGVAAIHESWVVHRDLKPGNLFLTPDGVVKVGDFGLARVHGSPERRYTGQVVTRWYRAPELLFGAKFYGTAIDLWSVGCIFAELLLRVPYFPGNSDIDQLSKIFTALGTPTEEAWPGVSSLPDYIAFREQKRSTMRDLFTAASDDTLDLLQALLTFNPTQRLNARAALAHRYFSSAPPPPPRAALVPKPRRSKS